MNILDTKEPIGLKLRIKDAVNTMLDAIGEVTSIETITNNVGVIHCVVVRWTFTDGYWYESKYHYDVFNTMYEHWGIAE